MIDRRMVRVEDIAEQVAMGPFGSNIKVETFQSEGIPIISGTHLHEVRLTDGIFNFITPDHANRLGRSNVRRGDVIFTHAGNIGQVAYIPHNSKYDRYVISQRQFYLRCNEQAIPQYIAYYFRSPIGQHDLLANASQVGVPSIARPASYLKSIKIELPSVEEQSAIAKILTALDDKIELNRRMNETLEQTAQAIFSDWFVNFGPTRRKQDGASDPVAIMGGLVTDPERARQLADLFPARLADNGLPEGWANEMFASFVNIIGGGTPKTSIPEYWGGDIPWYSVVDTPPKGSVFVVATEKSITSTGLTNSSVRLVRAGTTIISARGTVGNLAIAGRDMTFNQSCYGLQGINGAGDLFVFLACQRGVERLKGMAHGSVFSTITRRTFESLDIVAAPLAVMDAFEDIVGPLFRKIKASVEQNRTLAATRDLLLPKLMSGQIRLAEAKEQMEAAQ